MAHNNDALYDAVVAGAGGGAQHGWLVLSTPASYTPFATNIDVLATAVDLQIPTIAGGASISQINLLQSITHSVLTARYPVPVAPATYIDIGKAIAAVYTELEKLLTNQPTVASYGVNWLVTDWYIDGTVGDDANSGVVIGAPIKTGAELLRRLGPYAMWPQSVVVHVLANGMIDALVLRGLMMVAGNHLDVVGTPTQLADAGTVVSYTGIDHATPKAPEVTTTLIIDWTAHTRKRLRCTTGTAVNAVTWIACANPAGAGLNVARTPRWSRPKLTTTTIYENVNPVVGDAIVVESLPPIPAITLQINGPLLDSALAYTNRQWTISSIDSQNIEVSGTAAGKQNYSLIFGCELAQLLLGTQLYTSTARLTTTGSLFTQHDTLSTTANTINPFGFINASLFTGLSAYTIYSYATQSVVYGSCLFQNAMVNAAAYSYTQFNDVQSFDITNAAYSMLSIGTASIVSSTNFSGANNAGYGISIANNSMSRFGGTTNLGAALGQARLTSSPIIAPLVTTQLLQRSDYAQKGITPAMVAGATIVTVPWYDNATQRVTVSHAAFAGTPGILSVQQISNTQFTITSSSALDTSTVNWTISALGRNIFISTV
jgi:hypothetical protein